MFSLWNRIILIFFIIVFLIRGSGERELGVGMSGSEGIQIIGGYIMYNEYYV